MNSQSPLPIKNLLFDLGGVLLDLDFNASLRAFQAFNRNRALSEVDQLLGLPLFVALETGNITPSAFRDELRELLQNPKLTDQEIDKAWCSMLLNVPSGKVKLLQKLASRFRIFLYSNTNAIHIEFFRQNFFSMHKIEWESLFSACYYSHIIKDRKPLRSGFEKVIYLAGIKANETLFIDDLSANVDAAADAGLMTAIYRPGQDLARVLNATLGEILMDSEAG